MQIQVATISHRHGVNGYASKTKKGIEKQVADYCREYWADAFPGEDPPADMKDSDAIDAYFEAVADEFYNIDVATLGD